MDSENSFVNYAKSSSVFPSSLSDDEISRSLISPQKKYLLVVSMGMMSVGLVMRFYVIPQISVLYREFDANLSPYSRIILDYPDLLWVLPILFCGLVYFYLNNLNVEYTKVDIGNGQVRVNYVPNKLVEKLVLMVVGLGVGLIVFSVIMPIYNIVGIV